MKIGLLRESIGHIIINPILYFSTFNVGKELHFLIYRGNKINNIAAFKIMKLALHEKFNIIFIDSNFIFRIVYNIFYRFNVFNNFKPFFLANIFNIHHNQFYEEKYAVKFKTWTNNPISLAFTFPQEDDFIFKTWKNKIKLTDNFVCIFSRDSTFHNDANISIRDTDFINLVPSVIYLINCGYQVVRMGRDHSKNNLIDSILEPYKNNYMFYDYDSINEFNDIYDIFLLKYCKYFISNNSGIIMPSYFFNTPLIIYDWVPSGIQPYFSDNSVYILKKYFYKGILQKYENIPNELKIIENEYVLNDLGYQVKGSSSTEILEYIKRSISTELLDSICPPENMIIYGGKTKIDRIWYEDYLKSIINK